MEASRSIYDTALLSIFELLPVKALGCVALVCSKWKILSEQDFIWRKKYFERYITTANTHLIIIASLSKKIFQLRYAENLVRLCRIDPNHAKENMYTVQQVASSQDLLILKAITLRIEMLILTHLNNKAFSPPEVWSYSIREKSTKNHYHSTQSFLTNN